MFELMFSDRCSPSQFLRSTRYTEFPCKSEGMLDVHAVVISVSSSLSD